MYNRVNNAIKQYDEYVERTGRGGLYVEDIVAIEALVVKADRSASFTDTVIDSMKAGFMFGYRCAQRDARRKTERHRCQ